MATIYQQRQSLKLDPESLRLVEYSYDQFVHAGAKLSDADKTELKKLNEELATLSNDFTTKLLAATKAAAYVTTDKAALAGLSDAQISAAAEAAKSRKVEGFVLPLQNTTQQPDLVALTNRATREALFANSWDRAERGDANDTRDTIATHRTASRPEGQAARVSQLRRLEAGRPDGQNAGSGAEVHGRAGAGGNGPGRQRSPRHPGRD